MWVSGKSPGLGGGGVELGRNMAAGRGIEPFQVTPRLCSPSHKGCSIQSSLNNPKLVIFPPKCA